MQVPDFLEFTEKYLAELGFSVERSVSFAHFGFGSDLCARKSGRSLLVFFPYEDFLFFYDFGRPDCSSADNLEAIHEKARGSVNSLYRMPRALRYKVPNIVTVAVSGNGFPVDVQRYAAERKNSIIGGEKNSVFLVDLVNKRVVSQGLETTYSDMVAIRFDRVNPSNRAYHLVCDMAKELFSREG